MLALLLAAAVAGATPPANAWDLWGPSSNVGKDGALPSIEHPQSLIPPEALRHAKQRVASLEDAARRVHEGLGSATCKAPDQDRVITGKVLHEEVLALVVVRAQERKPVGALLADSLRFARRIAGCCGGALFVNAGIELQLESLVAIGWAAEHGLLTSAERAVLAGPRVCREGAGAAPLADPVAHEQRRSSSATECRRTLVVQANLAVSAPAIGRGISALSTMDSFSPKILRVLREKGRP